MKKLMMILFIILSTASYGQHWKLIPGTNIYFSNLIDSASSNWSSYECEYFKKNDLVMVVDRNVSRDFFPLFKKSPVAFDQIFQAASFQISDTDKFLSQFPDSFLSKTDSILRYIPHKLAVTIVGMEIISGYKEEIWVLSNMNNTTIPDDPCFLNVVFKKKKSKELKFERALRSHCNI